MAGRRGSILLWLSMTAAVAVYLVMVIWSLPRISAEAGGQTPFDMRPLGYSATEARSFLGALSDDGRRFYTDIQHRLDLAYPALLALTLALAVLRLFRSRAARALLIACAVMGMAFDYGENWLVGTMLTVSPDAVTNQTIELASAATLGKSILTTLVLSAVLIGIGFAAARRLRRP